MTYTCSECNQTKTETIEKTGHSATKTAAKKPTCTEDGNKEYWHCSKCKKYFSDSACTTETTLTATIISKTGHKEVTVPAVAATCTKTGLTEGKKCSVCGTITKEQTTVAALGHNYSSEWTPGDTSHWHACTRTDCTAVSGTAEHTFILQNDGANHWQECTVCHYKKDTEAHNFTEHSDEICRWQECGECHYITGRQDHVYTQEYDDTNHWFECTTCHVVKGEAAHTLLQKNNDDRHWLECACGYIKDDEAHDWDVGVITTPPTCTEKGVKTYTCTDCGAEKTEALDAKGHNLTLVPELPATEDKEGKKEHYHCDDCGKDFEDEDGKKEVTADDLRIGKLEREVRSGENAPKTKLATSTNELIAATLTAEEEALIELGTDIKILLTVEDAADKTSEEDKTAVEEAIGGLSGYKLEQYLDINLLKIIGGKEEAIHETNAPLTITFELPAELRGSRRIFSVIRVHGGETTVLNDLDKNANTVTIETDRFSTYALTFTEKPAASSSSVKRSTASTQSEPDVNGKNPETGIALACFPPIMALAVIAAAIKSKKKK